MSALFTQYLSQVQESVSDFNPESKSHKNEYSTVHTPDDYYYYDYFYLSHQLAAQLVRTYTTTRPISHSKGKLSCRCFESTKCWKYKQIYWYYRTKHYGFTMVFVRSVFSDAALTIIEACLRPPRKRLCNRIIKRNACLQQLRRFRFLSRLRAWLNVFRLRLEIV